MSFFPYPLLSDVLSRVGGLISISLAQGNGKRLSAATACCSPRSGSNRRSSFSTTKSKALHWTSGPRVPGGSRGRVGGTTEKMDRLSGFKTQWRQATRCPFFSSGDGVSSGGNGHDAGERRLCYSKESTFTPSHIDGVHKIVSQGGSLRMEALRRALHKAARTLGLEMTRQRNARGPLGQS